MKRRKNISLVLMVVLLSPALANADVVLTFGEGSAITQIDRIVTYTGLVNGTPFANYSEDGVFTTHPTDVANCQGTCGSFGFGSGGFYYNNGFAGFVSIRTTDGQSMYGVELQIGSGFSITDTVGHWEAFAGGDMVGSGEFSVGFGSVIGFFDSDLFDELRIATYSPFQPAPTFFDPNRRQTTAMDNVKVQLTAPDTDGDGVLGGNDYCPDTEIPESVPTMGYLKPNRWALTNDDTDFDTVSKGRGKGPGRSYTTSDTAGCSCEQIIEMQGLGEGHTLHGCSISAMDHWVELVTP